MYDRVTKKEITEALSNLNKGNAADIFGAITEHLMYADKDLVSILSALINGIFSAGALPKSLKIGLLMSVLNRRAQVKKLRTIEEKQ